MRIINIVDSVASVNFGIWNASIAQANWLLKLNTVSEIWFPKSTFDGNKYNFNGAIPFELEQTSIDYLKTILKSKSLNPSETVIVTHGTWQYATHWGHYLKSQGFKWIYMAHGMLEPWSMQQKALKKRLYFHFVEYPKAKKADVVRAVSITEKNNLIKQFKKVIHIPNSVEQVEVDVFNKTKNVYNFLFMARLHHKKGIIPLIKAWNESKLANNPLYQLYIAGPDDGELENLKQGIQSLSNVRYVGTIFGKEKEQMLQNAHFYILPSFSEGFPTSVVEAMMYGLNPLITKGCNFPEVMDKNFVLPITTEIEDIKQGLEKAIALSPEQISTNAIANRAFITNGYTNEIVAKQIYDLVSQ